MSCDALMDQVSASIAQATALDEATRAHLATCPACSAEAAELARLWDELGALPPRPADPARRSETVRLGRVMLAHLDRPARPVQQPRRPWATLAFSGVALLLGLFAGYHLQRGSLDGALELTAEPSYLLLLHEPPSDASGPEEDNAAIVEEYRAWAEELTAEGRLLGAEKLTDEPGQWVVPEPDLLAHREDLRLSGYFIVRATSYANAARLAQSSPHLRHGGSVEIRAIETSEP